MKMATGHGARASALLVFSLGVLLAVSGVAPAFGFSVKTLQGLGQPASHSEQGLKADRFEGFDSHLEQFPRSQALPELPPKLKAEDECEEAYGLLPCSKSVGGNIFLLVAYGYLMLQAAQCLSEGSELLLTVVNPGLIGGLLLPVLGCLPDAILIAGTPSGRPACLPDPYFRRRAGCRRRRGYKFLHLRFP